MTFKGKEKLREATGFGALRNCSEGRGRGEHGEVSKERNRGCGGLLVKKRKNWIRDAGWVEPKKKGREDDGRFETRRGSLISMT